MSLKIELILFEILCKLLDIRLKASDFQAFTFIARLYRAIENSNDSKIKRKMLNIRIKAFQGETNSMVKFKINTSQHFSICLIFLFGTFCFYN